jgi:hypothetical protein
MKTLTLLRIHALIILSAVLWLPPSGRAATITGTITSTANAPLATNITFSPLSTPQVNGNNTIPSTISTVTSAANGTFSTTLNAGDYKVTLGNAARDSFIITVPTNSATYQLNGLITSALAYNATASPANELKLNKGQTNGYAALNANALVPATQLATGTPSTTTYLRGDGTWSTANDPTALKSANNLSDLPTKSQAAQNVGVYPLTQSGSSWGGFAATTPSYVRQLGLMENGGGVPYLVWSKSTAQGDWQGGFAFYGQCQFGDPTHMNPTRDIGEFKFIVNGTGAIQDPATLSSPADNVMRWRNQCNSHFSAVAWDSCDADGLGERGAMGYGNSACSIYSKLNYLESYGTASSFLFAGSGFLYSGMEKVSGDFVRYSSGTSADDASRVTYRVKATGETRQNGDSYVQGIIRAGTGALSGGGYLITTTDGHLNTQFLDPTQTATINRVLFSTKGVPSNPAIDIGLNATGFDAQNYNLSIDVVGLPKLTFDSSGTFARFTNACSVGFGGTPNTTCAQVDIQSTTKGLLLPRMTKAQRDAISSPVAGLVIYQTDNIPGLRVYNGSNWVRFTETIDFPRSDECRTDKIHARNVLEFSNDTAPQNG